MSGSVAFSILLGLPAVVGLLISSGRRVSLILPLTGMGFLFGIGLSVALLLGLEQPWLHRFEWLPGLEMGWGLDRVALALVLLVYLISGLVHVFSTYYLKGDPGIFRYFGFLGFFTSSMIGLLSADHLLLLFIFWELVGFSSFLLIGFWYRDVQKSQAARTAFMTNRVADVCLLFGILIFWVTTGDAFISGIDPGVSGHLITLATLGMVIGAMGKSAQFPFHTWLPHAMAGPTPVSALIHAATMVAAGVYLLVRIAPIFPVEVQIFAAFVGGITALLAAFFAIAQYDIKKVLAYSTISQLGYMFMAAGSGAVEIGFFHLWTHAFFKAGLFLSVGVIIHTMAHVLPNGDPQDMRLMQGIRARLPFTFIVYTICLFALVGLPFFSGFFSKDAVLAAMWSWFAEVGGIGMVPFAFSAMAVLGTAYYMGRQWWLIFGEPSRGDRSSEPWLTVRLPLLVLAAGSLWFWYALNPFGHEVALVSFLFPAWESPAFVGWIAPVSIGLVAVGWAFTYRFRQRLGSESPGPVMKASYHGIYIDQLYRLYLIKPYGKVATAVAALDTMVIDRIIGFMAISVVVLGKIAGLWDRWVIDGFVNFTAYLSRKVGVLTKSFQSHSMQTQMFWILVGVATLIFWGIYYLPNV